MDLCFIWEIRFFFLEGVERFYYVYFLLLGGEGLFYGDFFYLKVSYYLCFVEVFDMYWCVYNLKRLGLYVWDKYKIEINTFKYWEFGFYLVVKCRGDFLFLFLLWMDILKLRRLFIEIGIFCL